MWHQKYHVAYHFKEARWSGHEPQDSIVLTIVLYGKQPDLFRCSEWYTIMTTMTRIGMDMTRKNAQGTWSFINRPVWGEDFGAIPPIAGDVSISFPREGIASRGNQLCRQHRWQRRVWERWWHWRWCFAREDARLWLGRGGIWQMWVSMTIPSLPTSLWSLITHSVGVTHFLFPMTPLSWGTLPTYLQVKFGGIHIHPKYMDFFVGFCWFAGQIVRFFYCQKKR